MDNQLEGHKDLEESKEKEIDLLVIGFKLWSRKKIILIWCLWGVLAGLIIAFSIPREYNTTAKLAPEYRSRSAGLSGGLSTLANMAGISTSVNTSTDAVYPQLYPDIVNSIPFIMSLMDTPVEDKDNNSYTVEEYILQKTKGPWWNVVLGIPGKMVNLLKGNNQPEIRFEETNDSSLKIQQNFRLTPKEYALVGALRGRVSASVDQKTNVISINVLMQDPVVSAILADTVVSRLREYVTNYRTNKARKDLAYALKLNAEAQKEYYDAQQHLADYIDRNQNLATQSARITRERMENEVSLAFNLYNETSLQVQHAKSKVQETTPVYTEITPATVPIRPTSPRKGLIIGGCTFLAFIISCCWVIFSGPILSEYKEKVKSIKEVQVQETKNSKDSYQKL